VSIFARDAGELNSNRSKSEIASAVFPLLPFLIRDPSRGCFGALFLYPSRQGTIMASGEKFSVTPAVGGQDEIQKLHQLAGRDEPVRAIAKALTRSEESVATAPRPIGEDFKLRYASERRHP